MSKSDLHVFDRDRGYHSFLADAYEGGLAWEHPSSPTMGVSRLYHRTVAPAKQGERGDEVVEREIATVNTYLSPWPGETLANFTRRRRLAVYINLVQPIVDSYVDSVTEHVTRDLDALAPYMGNLDRQGQTWADFVDDVARQVALDGVTAVVLDAPTDNPARTRADEIAAGVGLRATLVPKAAWAWLELGADGDVEEFAYADSVNVDPTALHQRVRVWVWSRVGWAVFEHVLPAADALEKHRDAIRGGEPVRAGRLPAGLARVPVEFAYHRRVRRTRSPRGTSIAAAPAAISLQVYQLLSAIEDTHRRSPPFLSVPTRASNGLEPETKALVGPGAALESPEGNAPQWVTFPPESLADIRAHAIFLVALAFRVSGLEVQADQSAQVQSGEALRLRSRDFEARAKKLARDLLRFEVRALGLARQMLGGIGREATVVYPQRFVLGDPNELLSKALVLMEAVGKHLGTEGVEEVLRQALSAALALDDATLARIMKEVSANLAKASVQSTKDPFAYDYDAGIYTLNEARATKGLPPVEGGDVSVLEWVRGIEARVAALPTKNQAPTPAAPPTPPPTPPRG